MPGKRVEPWTSESDSSPPVSTLLRVEVVGPDDPERARRLPWSTLMKRTWGLCVLVCPRCAGPMRLVSVIEDERVARKILEHLGLPARAPPRGRPWRPGQQQLALRDDPDRFDGVDTPAFEN